MRLLPVRTDHVRGSAAFEETDRKSTRLNSSHGYISYAVFCLKKKKSHNFVVPAWHLQCSGSGDIGCFELFLPLLGAMVFCGRSGIGIACQLDDVLYYDYGHAF